MQESNTLCMPNNMIGNAILMETWPHPLLKPWRIIIVICMEPDVHTDGSPSMVQLLVSHLRKMK